MIQLIFIIKSLNRVKKTHFKDLCQILSIFSYFLFVFNRSFMTKITENRLLNLHSLYPSFLLIELQRGTKTKILIIYTKYTDYFQNCHLFFFSSELSSFSLVVLFEFFKRFSNFSFIRFSIFFKSGYFPSFSPCAMIVKTSI